MVVNSGLLLACKEVNIFALDFGGLQGGMRMKQARMGQGTKIDYWWEDWHGGS